MWILRIKNSFMFLSGCFCKFEEKQTFFFIFFLLDWIKGVLYSCEASNL